MSRTEFAESWWYRVGVPHDSRRDPAVLVFFNAPFDISRLAAGVVSARRDLSGGFSFQVMANADGTRKPYRPDVAVKQIDSKRALKKNRATETGQSHIEAYSGHYLDLRTATFSLTGVSQTLNSACAAYKLPGKSTPVLGTISLGAVEYCRRDVAITAQLFGAVVDDFDTHPIDLQLTKSYPPASIAKSYLDSMGIKPLLSPGGAGAHIPEWVLGVAMSAFYGGRAECHYRLIPTVVTLVDFTSMYPTVNALMGSSGAHPMPFGNRANHYSLEHIYPQTENIGSLWEAELQAWRVDRDDMDERRYVLGNFTAVTNYDNKRNGKKPFGEKKKLILACAPLRLHDSVKKVNWKPSVIDARSELLANAILKRWPER